MACRVVATDDETGGGEDTPAMSGWIEVSAASDVDDEGIRSSLSQDVMTFGGGMSRGGLSAAAVAGIGIAAGVLRRARSPPMRSLHFPRHCHSPSSSRSLPFPLASVLVPPPCAPSTSPFTITPLPRRVLSPSPSLACSFPPPCAPSTSPVTITPLPRHVLSPSPSRACTFPSHALPPLPPSLSLPFLVAFYPLPLASVLVPPPCAPSISPVTITPLPRRVLSPSPR
ncbi:unnamed protein product [Closterium sp. Naga37s-1]|nr:unnamed protein product [Closterium sp. Naga37s-1]